MLGVLAPFLSDTVVSSPLQAGGRCPANTAAPGLGAIALVPLSQSEGRSVASHSLRPHGLRSPWNAPGQNTGMGSLSLLQGIFPTQGLNPGLPHCRGNLYQLNHQGRPRILERVAYPFSSGSSRPRNRRGLLHCRWILYQLSGKPRKHISFLFF